MGRKIAHVYEALKKRVFPVDRNGGNDIRSSEPNAYGEHIFLKDLPHVYHIRRSLMYLIFCNFQNKKPLESLCLYS